MMEFTTHKGEKITGAPLQRALETVADDWAQLARDIRAEDAYASHVTEAEKDQALQDQLADAERIRQGEVASFTIWQRVDTQLTGECVALLP